MAADLQILIASALTIACLHTLTGPDHYLPFIVLSRSRQWTFGKTIFWTVTCGLGHVLSSVVLGLGGAAIGWSMSKISWTENVRGGVAAWALLVFGLAYTIWGLWRARQNKAHKHFDVNTDGSVYVYEHNHGQIVAPAERHKVTPWVMFIIFVLGPCEPMIPLLYFPAAQNSIFVMVLMISLYTAVTLLTMLAMVILGYFGVSLFRSDTLEKHMHSLAGAALTVCGAGMVFLGW